MVHLEFKIGLEMDYKSEIGLEINSNLDPGVDYGLGLISKA